MATDTQELAPVFYTTAIAQMERIHVRRRLKQITNAQGWPVFGNIARIGPDGTPARVFLQEELFGPEEYGHPVANGQKWAVSHRQCCVCFFRCA